MRPPQTFEKKMEEMKPSKRYAISIFLLGGSGSFDAMMTYNKLGISLINMRRKHIT
jgi:hypothetical protein